MASSASRLTVRRTAKERDLILMSFMRATIEQIAIISLISHCPFESQYIGIKISPVIVEIRSSSLIFLNNFILKLL